MHLIRFIGATIAVALVTAGCTRMIERRVFRAVAIDSAPASVGLRPRDITIRRREREFGAWFVAAERAPSPVVVLFHGIGGSRSSWLPFQRFLRDSGVSSVSFDYAPQPRGSRAGSSRTGEVAVVVAALMDSIDASAPGRATFLLVGHSLGCAIALEVYPRIDTSRIGGVALGSAFVSIKDWSIANGRLPRFLAFTVPNRFDNISGVRRVRHPVLVLHSRADRTNPFENGQRVFAAAHEPKAFIEFADLRHNAISSDAGAAQWRAILAFARAHERAP